MGVFQPFGSFRQCIWRGIVLGALLLPALSATAEEKILPFAQAYCVSCHGATSQKAGLNLEALLAGPRPFENIALWENLAHMVATREMPPENAPQPAPDAVQELLEALELRLQREMAELVPRAGRVTLRRLNRAEYNNTVRDLLGVHFRPADDFPPDDSGYGFDTIGDVLSLSPMLMEKYLNAAETVSRAAIAQETGFYSLLAPEKKAVFRCTHPGAPHTLACARDNLGRLARRAYRRPVTTEEVEALVQFVEMGLREGETLDQALALGLQAMLVSPHFLFRIEQDPEGEVPRISSLELATRLAYFLWSSMPDEELLDLAEAGGLGQREVREAQVRRMIADPKSAALAANFAGQWLEFRNLSEADPDPQLFPQFDAALREAMAAETTLFFEHILRENRSILDFLDADYTFLNAALARHYGIEGVEGEAFQRVAVDPTQRGGILTQASVLTVTSYPNRTSPVLRGVWVLQNILAAPPPPPPPNVPALDQAQVADHASLRARLEAHRKDPSCASCHNRIDPLGFGLENYDSIGTWRTQEGDHPIDSSGVLPGGEAFAGPSGLKRVLLQRKDDFARALTEKMLTYALGRGVEPYDRPAVDQMLARLAEDRYRFQTLVLEIVESLPFQQRQAEMEAQ